MRFNTARIALLALDGFAALTAIGGGIALMTGLEGDRFPLEMLRGTPFSSYLLPGLILAVCVGGSAGVAAVAILRSPPVGAAASLLAGVVMMGWIAGEILLLDQPSEPTGIEAFYFVLSLLMAGVGLLVWQVERRKRTREVRDAPARRD